METKRHFSLHLHFSCCRMSEENGKTRENSDAVQRQAASGPSSSTDDAKMMMEKMHDLSFMLESKLSIPPK